jgi:inner membrane protein
MSRFVPGSSTTFKLFVLGMLSLLLLIPLGLIHDLVQERAGMARQAEDRIAAGWGREQQLLLPMLRFEYFRDRVDKDGVVTRERRQRLLSPASAQVAATLGVETRKLGIHALPIYTAQVRIEGRFQPPLVLAGLDDPDSWTLQQISLAFAPGDLTGLREIRRFDVGAVDLQLKPSTERWNLQSNDHASSARPVLAGVLAPAMAAAASLPFQVELELAGARAFDVIPNAAEFAVAIAGDWPHPGFAGGALPRQREISDAGFSADWRLMDLSTGIPAVIGAPDALAGWGAQAVGVALVEPGGLYQQNERSAKYGILVLALTMAALFLTEVLVGVRLHPFHYALVGLALAVFYLLLLALSEHLGFVAAYLMAAGAVVVMVGGYSAAVLGGWVRGGLSAAVLATLYGFLLVLIRAEELSLLLGAIGLAVLLAAAMFLTRRLDWYSAGPTAQTAAEAP